MVCIKKISFFLPEKLLNSKWNHGILTFLLNFCGFQFSISAINDTDSKNQWQPLAPTKEAQASFVTPTLLMHLYMFGHNS